jgi:hypothetical protein
MIAWHHRCRGRAIVGIRLCRPEGVVAKYSVEEVFVLYLVLGSRPHVHMFGSRRGECVYDRQCHVRTTARSEPGC